MWKPIRIKELEKIIKNAYSGYDIEKKYMWKSISVKPMKWKLSPWGDLGGGFWVVGIIGKTAIYYNDIEDGFNFSEFNTEGNLITYGAEQLSLDEVLSRIKNKMI